MNKRLVAMLFAVSCVSVSAQESEVADVQIENEAAADVSSVETQNNNEADAPDVACNGDFCGALSQNDDAETSDNGADVDVEPKVVELA